jgi:hypothetical protein
LELSCSSIECLEVRQRNGWFGDLLWRTDLFWQSLYGVAYPLPSYLLNSMDGQLYNRDWNQLPQDALVFDPIPSRATTIFGRFTDAGLSWYVFKEEWRELANYPDPLKIKQAGYDFIYADTDLLKTVQGCPALTSA